MNSLFVKQYDAFGDWVSANGLIRYLIEEQSYDKVYLVLEYNDSRKNFVNMLYGDDPRITTIMDTQVDSVCSLNDDVIDLRSENNPRHRSRNHWCNQNPYGNHIHTRQESNSDKFYTRLGIDPKIKNDKFFFLRKHDLEEELFSSLDVEESYSVVCDYGENLIDRKYVKHKKIINLHNISPNLVDVLKILENSDDIHLIENTIGLFVYHLQCANLLDRFDVNLHAYARKESHRKCDGPDCNNPYLNMLLLPKLDNWEVVWN